MLDSSFQDVTRSAPIGVEVDNRHLAGRNNLTDLHLRGSGVGDDIELLDDVGGQRLDSLCLFPGEYSFEAGVVQRRSNLIAIEAFRHIDTGDRLAPVEPDV